MATRIVLNSAGLRQILRSKKVQEDLERRAQAIAKAAGSGTYTASVIEGRNRAHASVITDDYEARQGEADNRALTRAIGHGR